MNIIFVADYFVEDYKGGAEYADFAFIEELQKHEIIIKKMRTQEYNSWCLQNDISFENIIFGNFSYLTQEAINKTIKSKCKYIINEYDHKYVKLRDSARYENNLAPIDQIINRLFYKNALRVFAQTTEHANILFKNLNIKNISIIHGSMWSDEEFDNLLDCSKNITKENKKDYLIIDNSALNKGTYDSIELARKQNWPYKLIKPDKSYKDFIKEMAKYSNFIFTPRCFEGCSRVALEARMLNMSVVLNDNVPAKKEFYFKEKKGTELIFHLKNLKRNVVLDVLDLFNGEKFGDFKYIAHNNIVTIVAPSYNDSKYLDKFFENVLNQTYDHIELIFVDDCSTDNTFDIVMKWVPKFENTFKTFKYVKQYKNLGTGSAINKGFKIATGYYQTWWSTDDEKDLCCIENLVNVLQKEEKNGTQYVISPYFSERYNSNWRSIFVKDNNLCINPSGFTNESVFSNNVFILENKEFVHLTGGQCHQGVCFMWTAPLLYCCGKFDEYPGEDYTMSMMMAIKSENVAYLDKLLGVHKAPSDSLTAVAPNCGANAIQKVKEIYRMWNNERNY